MERPVLFYVYPYMLLRVALFKPGAESYKIPALASMKNNHSYTSIRSFLQDQLVSEKTCYGCLFKNLFTAFDTPSTHFYLGL